MTEAGKYFLSLTTLVVLLSVCGRLLLGECFFVWWWSLPIFFGVLGVANGLMIGKMKTLPVMKQTTFQLLLSSLRIVLSLAFVCLYYCFVKENVKEFLISFLLFYVVFIAFETIMTIKTMKK